MLILLSPAKSFDFESLPSTNKESNPLFVEESTKLAVKMKSFSVGKIGGLMKISPDLSKLNVERFKNWTPIPERKNVKQAVLAFNGEAYKGLNASNWLADDFDFAQDHLRILSGLYGVLRPLDLMQAYRLEMGTKLKYYSKTNLYQFWGDKITERLNKDLNGSNYVINLASTEYYKSVKESNLKANVITPVFKDFSNGTYKMLMTYAKNARGAMTRFIIKNKLTNPEYIQAFTENGYRYDIASSDEKNWVFLRG